jgi:hypothetical protein
MKTVSILPMAIVLSCLCLASVASAERTLPNSEILDILDKVTQQPRDTWIPAGTLQATHQEYGAAQTTNAVVINSKIQQAIQDYQNEPDKREMTPDLQKMKLDAIPFNVRYELSNEYTMKSRVVVKYDGERFYWEINVDSRQDSVRPDASLAGNFMTDQFDLNWNGRRIFAWDGQKYTTYSASGKQAIVDAAGTLPRAVNGPLTAGLIPWGYSRYTYASLAAAQISAREVDLNGKTQIEMTITYADGAVTGVTFDPSKDYAVTGATFDGGGDTVVSYACSDYRLVAGKQVPFNVSIERRDSATRSLRGSEGWTFTSVSTSTPAASSFSVPLGLDTLVEYKSPLSTASSLYDYSPTVDTDDLLMQRLSYQATQGRRPQNCGTAALQYVASRLGRSVSDGALARLVGPGGQTNLLAMKQFAQGLGLYSRAVRTDLATLKNLEGVTAILHIPGKDHFLILSEVDDRYVWLIDLSNDKFHYRQSVDFFPQEWSEGTALLVSDRPISGRFTDIPDGVSTAIAGSTGWSCTRLLQYDFVFYCIYLSGDCDGALTVYFTRYGCEITPSGSCSTQAMVRYQQSPCIWDPVYVCKITGQWYYAHLSACK